MTTAFEYTLTAETPLAAGQSDQRANLRRAHTVIPGATIRGALAAVWWRDHDTGNAQHQAEFARLFDNQLLVTQAVPEGMMLASASAQVCKYRPRPGCAAMYADRAFAAASACWECGGPLKADAGWRLADEGPELVPRTRSKLTVREQPEDGQLFTRQALIATRGHDTLTLTGTLRALEDAVGWLDGATLRIGGGRSLDYGRCILSLTKAERHTPSASGRQVLRLTSPAILLDEYGGPVVSLDALRKELCRVSGSTMLMVGDHPEWLRTEPVSGWHMRSRLPKPLDWAYAPGSTVVVDGLKPEAWAALSAGIGYRTLEGYGQLEMAPEPARAPTNEALAAIKTLRARTQRGNEWGKIRPQLISALKKMAEDLDQASTVRATATFPGVLGEVRGLMSKVLNVAPGQIAETLKVLEATR